MITGTCVRCKKETLPSILCRGKGQEVFSFNMCDACLITTSGVTRLRGNGDRIYEANFDAPKNFFYNVKNRAVDPESGNKLQKRSEDAKVSVLKVAKGRYVRRYKVGVLAI